MRAHDTRTNKKSRSTTRTRERTKHERTLCKRTKTATNHVRAVVDHSRGRNEDGIHPCLRGLRRRTHKSNKTRLHLMPWTTARTDKYRIRRKPSGKRYVR